MKGERKMELRKNTVKDKNGKKRTGKAQEQKERQ